MKGGISKLSLFGFRGATKPLEISFDTSKPVTLVFGENGTGKSTIADAIDFVCNGHFGSLEDRSMSSKPKSHVTALGQDPKKLKVVLASSKGNFTRTLGKASPVVSPSDGCPEARILRRSNVLKLLNSQPKERFDELKSFITVPGIERSEGALREATRLNDVGYNAAVSASAQASAALDDLWNAEGRPNEDPLNWAAEEAAKDLSALESTVSKVDGIATAFRDGEAALASLDRSAAAHARALEALASAETQLRMAEAEQSRQSASLLSLLQAAKVYVTGQDSLEDCPVCEQPVQAQDLSLRLETRIGQMNVLSGLVSAVTVASRGVSDSEPVRLQMQKEYCQRIRSLATLLKESALKEVKDLEIEWTEYFDLLADDQVSGTVETNAREVWTRMLPCWPLLDLRKQAEQKSINQRNAIKGHLDTHVEKLQTASVLANLKKKLDSALEIVSNRRKAYVEGILEAISDEVERLYTKLHPDEGIGKIRFYLKPSAIGSLEYAAQFQTAMDVPPQAYYSESHLDTLGICVFLALAKHFITDNTIVVLDDVVTSVDGPHLDRFMRLLHDEAPNFNQVIVTTHYRPWKDRYRNARGPAAKTQVIELRLWSFEWGVQLDEVLTAVKELRTCLAAVKMDRQAVASKAGIQLESILDFLTYHYGCDMPRQHNPNYTLGALAIGIDSKLGKLLKTLRSVNATQPREETLLKPIIDELNTKGWIRNQAGCHFSDPGSGITDSEIKEFGKWVIELTDALICCDCEEFPTSKRSGSFWQCGCGNVELYPLIHPGAPIASVKLREET